MNSMAAVIQGWGGTAKGNLTEVIILRSRSDLSSPAQDESLRKQGHAAAATTHGAGVRARGEQPGARRAG